MNGKRFAGIADYRDTLMTDGAAPFKCRAGSRYLYVDEHGMVRWCSQTRDRWGVALEDYSFAELRRQFATKKDCNAACTVGCVRNCSAPDQWRSQPLPSLQGPLVRIRKRPVAADGS